MQKAGDSIRISDDDLQVFAGALTNTVEYLDEIINSEHRPNKEFHDKEYVHKMAALKESRRDYNRMLRKVTNIQERRKKGLR